MRDAGEANRQGPAAGQERYQLGNAPAFGRFAAQRTAAFAAFFLPQLRRGMNLLDCGCGPGSITIDLAAAVAPGMVVGIDLQPHLVEQTRVLTVQSRVVCSRRDRHRLCTASRPPRGSIAPAGEGRRGVWTMAIRVTSAEGARLKQGQHPDPLAAARPDPATWPERRRRAFLSTAQRQYREELLRDGIADVRAAVIDDLAAYFGFTAEECVQRCVNWEAWSVAEWQARTRNSPQALADFYHTVQSWAFDLLWYAYLQAEGVAYPVAVAAAETLPPPRAGARHLDFGSGTGITSQLFMRLGYESELADVSTSLLAFAGFRLERRGLTARRIDLTVEALAAQRYDVITAIDTLVHVPDVAATARLLHRALRPGGTLFANFDVRPATAENAWHLYSDDLPLRWALQRAGFEPQESLDGMLTRYRWVQPHGPAHLWRGSRDLLLLRSPLRPVYRRARTTPRKVLSFTGRRGFFGGLGGPPKDRGLPPLTGRATPIHHKRG